MNKLLYLLFLFFFEKNCSTVCESELALNNMSCQVFTLVKASMGLTVSCKMVKNLAVRLKFVKKITVNRK